MLVFNNFYSLYLKIWILLVHSIQAKLTTKHSIHNQNQSLSQEPVWWKIHENPFRIKRKCLVSAGRSDVTWILPSSLWCSHEYVYRLPDKGLLVCIVWGFFKNCFCFGLLLCVCLCGYRVFLTQTKPWIWRWYSEILAASLSHVAAQCLSITHLVAHLVLGQRARLQFQNKTKQAFVFMPSVLQCTISLRKAIFPAQNLILMSYKYTQFLSV